MFASREWSDLFVPSVTLHLSPSGDIRHIKSAREATAVLLDEWPETAGPAYVAACRVCLAAARGRVNAARARLALIEAARESGMLVELHSLQLPADEIESVDNRGSPSF